MILKIGIKVFFSHFILLLDYFLNVYNYIGNRLMSVLMHQIGHLFGLDHSSNPSSVMSPLFHFGDENLLDEDVKNLRMILGLESSKFFSFNFISNIIIYC